MTISFEIAHNDGIFTIRVVPGFGFDDVEAHAQVEFLRTDIAFARVKGLPPYRPRFPLQRHEHRAPNAEALMAGMHGDVRNMKGVFITHFVEHKSDDLAALQVLRYNSGRIGP